MSDENVEIVCKALDTLYAFMCGELSREALAEVLDPQFEAHWRDQQTYPDAPQNLRGAPEILEFGEQYGRTWSGLAAEPLEVIEPQGTVSWPPSAKVAEAGKAASQSRSTSLRSSRSAMEG
jgi:hypothetical protein